MNKIPFTFYTILTVCIGSHLPAYAQGTQQSPEPSGPRPIPQEAVEACNGKTTGESCSFTGRMNHMVEGTCRTPPRAQGQVVCVPKPPQQAFDACKGKAEGETCTFTGRKGENVNGTCKKPPFGEEEMVCRPAKPPMPEGSQESNPPPALK